MKNRRCIYASQKWGFYLGPRLAAVLCALVLAGAPSAFAGKKWRLYENCTLIPNPANDGDSFHVKAGNKRHYLFRLYFADTPESDDSLPDRVAEQAAYWGITPADSVRMGKEAAKFTQGFLSKGFTVHSKLSDAMGRSEKDRDYAVVMVGDKDLAVELVRNGLARIYGTPVEYPDGTAEQTIWWRMKTAEREAQAAKRGAWGVEAAPANRFEALNPTPVIPEQERLLDRTIAIFSTQNPAQQLGLLQSGARLKVLKAESPTHLRIRFTTSSGQTYEALCRRADLGL